MDRHERAVPEGRDAGGAAASQSSIVNPLSSHGQIVLVQFNSMGDPENGGRFTVKKYHSAKTVSEDGWQHDRIELLPLNLDYGPIPVAAHEGPELVVVGEWVASICLAE